MPSSIDLKMLYVSIIIFVIALALTGSIGWSILFVFLALLLNGIPC